MENGVVRTSGRMGLSMDQGPLISVILPVYNIERYLPDCMEALSAQTYRNLEIILVDDGSRDNCGKMCDEYARGDERIVVYHKPNGGLSDARNYGIERARGEYITCIDPDDVVDPDYVEYLLTLLQKHGVRMSICQFREQCDGRIIAEHGKDGEEVLSAHDCLERMLYHDGVDTSAWAKLYHRDLFQTVRYPKGKLFEDIGTTYALMMQCDRIAVGSESKYVYRLRRDSIVNASFHPGKMDLLEMTDRMAKDVAAAFPDLKDAVLRRQVYARFSTINQMLNTDGYDRERGEMISFIKQHRGEVLRNPRTPRRDRIALVLISVSYRLYRRMWRLYLIKKTGK